MLTITNEKFIRFENGTSVVVAELNVDTKAELPEVDDIEGRTLHQGSTALIITEGKLAILGGDDKWYVYGEVFS